jgi:hypothetical protein
MKTSYQLLVIGGREVVRESMAFGRPGSYDEKNHIAWNMRIVESHYFRPLSNQCNPFNEHANTRTPLPNAIVKCSLQTSSSL